VTCSNGCQRQPKATPVAPIKMAFDLVVLVVFSLSNNNNNNNNSNNVRDRYLSMSKSRHLSSGTLA